MKEATRIVKGQLRVLLTFALVSFGSAVSWVNAQQTQDHNAGGSGTAQDAGWNTVGLRQANTMGAGAAPIPKGGKFRVFVLMGQSNMNGSGRATELKPPYTEKHKRIRIWANGRWEYFVPSNRFGPGVSFAHQLADFWPDDSIGIIKVSCGATGISAFEKNWTFERAQRSKDGVKGALYRDLMNAVAEAKRISHPEFCGFAWKQGAADGKKGLAEEYYDNFNQLILELSADLGVSNLPTFFPTYAKDKELLQAMLPYLNKEETLEAKKSAGEGPVDDEKFLHAVLSYIDDNDLLKTAKPAEKKAALPRNCHLCSEPSRSRAFQRDHSLSRQVADRGWSRLQLRGLSHARKDHGLRRRAILSGKALTFENLDQEYECDEDEAS